MKLSLNWLKDYLDLKLSPEALAEKLTLAGVTVETIERPLSSWQDFVVGEIFKIEPHPQADRLCLAQVKVSKTKKLSIVCGATNLLVGQKVPVALVGAVLPSGLAIKQASIRGVASEGMLCSGAELGMSDDQAGILILAQEAEVGWSLMAYLGLDDITLDLDVTPNRADCLSVLGLAREIGAILGDVTIPHKLQKIVDKEAKVVGESGNKTQHLLTVSVKSFDLCHWYGARVVTGLKVEPSPPWLQARLRAVGIRPINNIVDATNYVMLSYGQPLHAFDLDKIATGSDGKHHIIVRTAKSKEHLITLDGQTRELPLDSLVISDDRQGLAIAGVMGGQESEVSGSTKNVMLECAVFDQLSVAKTSRRLGVRTDASMRFERGVDLAMAGLALERVASLIATLSGGVVLAQPVIVSDPKAKGERVRITVSKKQVAELLGQSLDDKKVETILLSLGCAVMPRVDEWVVIPPTWRHDLKIVEDVIEEIGRIYGYANIQPVLPKMSLQAGLIDQAALAVNTLRQHIVGLGFDEIYTYSFYGEDEVAKTNFSLSSHLALVNPLSPDQKYLRRTLEPQLIEALAMNRRSLDEVMLFEIGTVYAPALKQALPQETLECALAWSRSGSTPALLLRELKGVVESCLEKLGLVTWQWQGGWGHEAELMLGKTKLGRLTVVEQAERYKLRSPAAWAVLSVSELIKHSAKHKVFTLIAHLPAVVRDVSLLFEPATEYGIIEQEIFVAGKFLSEVAFVDEYALAGQRSLTFRLTFQPQDKTLTGLEVDKLVGEIVSHLEKRFGAVKR